MPALLLFYSLLLCLFLSSLRLLMCYMTFICIRASITNHISKIDVSSPLFLCYNSFLIFLSHLFHLSFPGSQLLPVCNFCCALLGIQISLKIWPQSFLTLGIRWIQDLHILFKCYNKPTVLWNNGHVVEQTNKQKICCFVLFSSYSS